MLAAVSHLACLRESLFHWTGSDQVEARIHTHGQFSLVRGALENASRAVWMLEPDDPDERLLRRLQLEWKESCQQDSVRDLMGALMGGPRKSTKDRLEDLTALLPPATTDPDKIKSKHRAIKNGPDYVIIVKAAGKHVPSGSSQHLVIWRACSAGAWRLSRDHGLHGEGSTSRANARDRAGPGHGQRAAAHHRFPGRYPDDEGGPEALRKASCLARRERDRTASGGQLAGRQSPYFSAAGRRPRGTVRAPSRPAPAPAHTSAPWRRSPP